MLVCVLGSSPPSIRFISVSNSLPKTSYVKMIDIWLLFNLTIPFAEVKYLMNTTWPPPWQGAASNLHRAPPRPGGGQEDDQPPRKRSWGRSRPLVWEAFFDPSLWFEVSKLLAWWFRWVIFILCSASHGKLFSVNEEVQREALKEFYERFYHMKYVYSKDANLLLWKFINILFPAKPRSRAKKPREGCDEQL